jgi:hypothetical protein
MPDNRVLHTDGDDGDSRNQVKNAAVSAGSKCAGTGEQSVPC